MATARERYREVVEERRTLDAETRILLSRKGFITLTFLDDPAGILYSRKHSPVRRILGLL